MGFTPQPQGYASLWLLLALQMGVGAAIIWRRLRLRYATLGLALGCACGLFIAESLLSGLTRETAPLWTYVIGIGLWSACLLLAGLESLLNPEGWRAWSEHQRQHGSLLDVLLFRNIPRLR